MSYLYRVHLLVPWQHQVITILWFVWLLSTPFTQINKHLLMKLSSTNSTRCLPWPGRAVHTSQSRCLPWPGRAVHTSQSRCLPWPGRAVHTSQSFGAHISLFPWWDRVIPILSDQSFGCGFRVGLQAEPSFCQELSSKWTTLQRETTTLVNKLTPYVIAVQLRREYSRAGLALVV